jgi:hypothetical protein
MPPGSRGVNYPAERYQIRRGLPLDGLRTPPLLFVAILRAWEFPNSVHPLT